MTPISRKVRIVEVKTALHSLRERLVSCRPVNRSSSSALPYSTTRSQRT